MCCNSTITDLSLVTAGGGGTSATREENIRELLNFFPVIAEDHAGKMVEIDAKAVLTIPRQIKAREVLKRGFISNLLFDNISGIFQASQTVLDILNELPVEKEGKLQTPFDLLDFSDVKTFIDLYMKSGLYITELVKRLYNSEGLKEAFPNPEECLKHILENQVYGFAPSEIIYNISTNFIFGNLSQDISRKNFVLEDTIPAAKEGRIQELVDKYFG